MAKILREETVTQLVVDHYVCDKCGGVIPKHDDVHRAYTNPRWFHFDVGVYPYPGSWNVDHYAMEVCQRCAEDAVEVLKAAGYRVRKEHSEG